MLYVGDDKYRVYVGSQKLKPVVKMPYDAEVEYLESNGNQYIELPIKPSESTDAIEIEFRRTANTNQQRFFQATPNGSSGAIFQCYVNGSGRVAYNKNGTWQAVSSTDNTAIGVVYHKLKLDYYNKKITYDAQTYTMGATSRTSSDNLILLGKYSSNATFQGLVYHVKYWRNGTLLYDLQPVRKENTGYLYNKVDGELYGNRGTGSFTIGYDKLTSLNDYTLLDYIQNTSTAATAPYIDTGITSASVPLDMEMTVKWNTIDSTKRQLFGSDHDPWFGCDKGVYKNSMSEISELIPSTTEYTTYRMGSWNTTPYNNDYATMLLFRIYATTNRANTVTAYISLCKLKEFKIWVNNILVRDFVPVLHPTNVYGMFDIIENKFYASANSGTFTGGFDD